MRQMVKHSYRESQDLICSPYNCITHSLHSIMNGCITILNFPNPSNCSLPIFTERIKHSSCHTSRSRDNKNYRSRMPKKRNQNKSISPTIYISQWTLHLANVPQMEYEYTPAPDRSHSLARFS